MDDISEFYFSTLFDKLEIEKKLEIVNSIKEKFDDEIPMDLLENFIKFIKKQLYKDMIQEYLNEKSEEFKPKPVRKTRTKKNEKD